MRTAVTVMAKHWRRIAARRVFERRKWAVEVVRGLVFYLFTVQSTLLLYYIDITPFIHIQMCLL